MKKIGAHARLIYIIILVLGTLAYQALITSSKGIDFYVNMDTLFHLSRIIGLSNAFTSPVNFVSFASHGTMMNLFYPWLTLYPAYLIYALSHNLVLAWNLFLMLVSCTTALVSFYSFLSIRKSNAGAFIFSVLYTFSAYHTANMYMRTAVGETIAMAFLPLVFAGVYHILLTKWQKWPMLTFGMVLVIYSHLLSLAMNAAFILIFIIIALPKMTNRGQRALAMLKATVASLLISLPAILPMMRQSAKDDLLIPTAPLLNWIQSPLKLIGNFVTNDIARYTTGVLILAALIWLVIRFAHLSNSDRAILIVAIITLMATSTWFPWHWFTSWLPVYKMQYVTRLNSYITLFVAFVIANNFKLRSVKLKGVLTGVILVLSIALTASSVAQLRGSTFRRHAVITPETALQLAKSYKHTDYGNAAVKKHPEVFNGNLFLLNGKAITVRTKVTPNTYTTQLTAPNSGTLILPIFRYTGQTLTVNGKGVPSSVSSYGTTALRVHKGKSTIQVTYRYSRLAKACAIIAVVTLLGLIYSCLPHTKRRNLANTSKHASIN